MKIKNGVSLLLLETQESELPTPVLETCGHCCMGGAIVNTRFRVIRTILKCTVWRILYKLILECVYSVLTNQMCSASRFTHGSNNFHTCGHRRLSWREIFSVHVTGMNSIQNQQSVFLFCFYLFFISFFFRFFFLAVA